MSTEASRNGGRKLRVLQVGKFYPPHMGGIETHLENLCLALRDEVDLQVLVAGDARETVRETRDEIPITRVGTRFHLAAAPITPGLTRAIRQADADLIHVHLPHPTAVLSVLRSGHRGKLVATYHSDIVRQKRLLAAYRPFRNRFLRRCDRIIATSPNYLATSPVLQAHKERVTVLPYGIPTEGFGQADPGTVDEIRARFGDRMVISVGRLIYYKGFDVLVRAMAQVDGHLVLVGDGPLRGELESLAASLGISERVTFLGEVQNQDVIPYYHAAQVFALASVARSEAFGIVQLEAMACGTPVINTSLDSGVPFVSLDGETGLTVPPGDAESLGRALTRLLDDRELRDRFIANGRRRVAEEFSREVMARRVLDLYRSLAPTQFRGKT